MGEIRKADIEVIYKHEDITTSLRPYITSISVNDNLKGQLDDISISLINKDQLFLEAGWALEVGAIVEVVLVTKNWENANEGIRREIIGSFYIDDRSYNKASVTLKGISVPLDMKNQINSTSHPNITLKTLAQGIKDKYYSSSDGEWYNAPDISLKNVVQSKETDLSFIQKICEEQGMSIKVAFDELYIFDEERLEEKEVERIIDLKSGEILDWSFQEKTNDIYSSCVVTYKEPKASQEITGRYEADYEVPFKKELKYTLKSKADDFDALAKKLLKLKNNNAITCSISIIGQLNLLSGTLFQLTNAGKFNGKWIVYKTTKSLPGFKIKLEAYKVGGIYA